MAKIGKLSIEVEDEPTRKFTIGSDNMNPEFLVEIATIDGKRHLSPSVAKTFFPNGGQHQGVQLLIEEENPEA